MSEYPPEKRRREHDEVCEKRESRLKEWVADKICITKKSIIEDLAPTKMKTATLWTILFIVLSAAIGSAYNSKVSASAATVSASAASETRTINSSNIAHNSKELGEIKSAHAELVREQRQMAKDMETVKISLAEQTIILRELLKRIK